MSTVIPYNQDDEAARAKKRRRQFTVPEEFRQEQVDQAEQDEAAGLADSAAAAHGPDDHRRRYAAYAARDLETRAELADGEADHRDTDTGAESGQKRRPQDASRTTDGLPAVLKRSRWAPVHEKLAFPVIEGVPLTGKILDVLLPAGYAVAAVPEDYRPLDEQPPDWTEPPAGSDGYTIPQESTLAREYVQQSSTADVPRELQFLKDHDVRHFQTSLAPAADGLTQDDANRRRVAKLILKIKNGAPAVRKPAMRTLTDNARQLGSAAIFDQILPLMREPTLDDLERHLLVKVVGRILYRLSDEVKPDTRRILTAIAPLLADPDVYTRAAARDIVSNLSKAAGLAHMIATLKPDIDAGDDYVRDITTRTFAVVAHALGVLSLLPFLRAVCGSQKSWHARHAGAKIVAQISQLMGSGVLPHLNELVACVAPGLRDAQPGVRTASAAALAALAESAAPFGIESFEPALDPLWDGVKRHRGKALAAFLKAIGFVIPLMDPEYANHYSKEVFHVLIREFRSQDDEMRRTCLKIVQQCCATEGVDRKFLKEKALAEFFHHFWVRRVAMGRRISGLLVDTTHQLAVRCGVAEIVDRILVHLKDENEQFRKMAIETVDRIIGSQGSADLSARSVDLLLDGVVLAYQEQTAIDSVVLHGFATLVNSLGLRVKPHLTAIVSVILYRLKNKAPENRQQSADLIAAIAPVVKRCDEDDMLARLSNILYESLGEVYPDVLGSLLNAMASIITTVGVESVNPSISTIVPTLTPILRNRHEKVQEATIKLIGIIADRGPEFVNAREWMRICFELLEMLKSPRKSIRRSANATFGYLSKAIGPQDVLAALLDNLKVQERQLRVCTAVAIGIVAETCQPFTVLPALMNEYRTPEKNVQNGVLKAMTFIFEYISDNIQQEYVYAMVPLLEDALTDRDLVHRQTAVTVVKHMALGCIGNGLEDVFIHFLNLIFPNIFETSPHVIVRILESLDAVRVNVGNGPMVNYILAGLFHPARKVRAAYWKLYNDMYIQNADAIVPYYPAFEDRTLVSTDARIHELDIWV